MIRKFKGKDANEWVRIYKDNLLNVNSKSYPAEVVSVLVNSYDTKKVLKKSGTREMMVAEIKGEIAGTISMTRKGEIENLFVKPEHHGKGVGKNLLLSMETKAFEQGFSKTCLYSSENAQGFYEKQGYKKVKDVWEQINGKPYKVTLMEKKL